MHEILSEVIDKLEPDSRVVFTLRDVEELSTEETAKRSHFDSGGKIPAAAGPAQTSSEAGSLFSAGWDKLNCKGVILEISNYIDGELDLSEKQELERHLEHCEECKMVVDQTRLTVDIFCDSKPVELPGDVKSRLHDALRRKLSAKGN